MKSDRLRSLVSADGDENNLKEGFVILELFISFVASFCRAFGLSETILSKAEISMEYAFFRVNLVKSIFLWIAVIYSVISDNYLGKKNVIIYVGIYTVISPLVCFGTSLCLFIKKTQYVKALLMLALHSLGFIIAFRVMWRIVAMEQILLPYERGMIRKYIVSLEFSQLIGCLLGQTLTVFHFDYLPALSLLSLLAYLFCFGLLILNKDNVVFEEVEQYVLWKHLICWLRVLRKKVALFHPLKLYANSNAWFEVARTYPYTIRFLRNSRKSIQLLTLFAITIPIFTVLQLLWFTTIHFQAGVLKKNNIISHLPILTIMPILMLFSLSCFEFVILPLIHAVKINAKYFHTITFGFSCVTLGILASCILDHQIQEEGVLAPTEGLGQVRIYNLMSQRVAVESLWFPFHWIEPWEVYNVLTVPMSSQSASTNLTVFIVKDTNTTVISNNVFEITAYDDYSYSYIISSGGFTRFKTPDPLIYSSDEEGHVSKARVYIMSPLTNEFIGYRTIWFFNSDGSVVTSVEFPGRENKTVFTIPGGTYKISLRSEPNSPHVVYSNEFVFLNGAIYAMIIMLTEEVKDPTLNHTFIKSFSVLPSNVLSFNWIYPQLILYSLSEVILSVHLSIFLYLESPPKIRGFILTLCFAMAHSGFGLHFFVDWKEKPSSVLLMTYFFISSITLIFFCSGVYKYRSNPNNRPVFVRDSSDFF